jgi:uncharacterized protein
MDTEVEVALITVNVLMVSSELFDQYINAIGNNWNIGQTTHDQGIIIGISDGWAKVRISTTNKVEKAHLLSDYEAQQIITDFFIPEFRRGEFNSGLVKGLSKMKALILANRNERMTPPEIKF